MTEENVNQDEDTRDEAGDVAEEAPETEAETTDAPVGVADVENVQGEAAAEAEEATTPDLEESVAAADPPAAEPATDEPESVPEAVGEGPAAEPDSSDAPADEPVAAAPAPEPKRKKKRLPRPLRRRRPKPKREHAAERKPITRLPKPQQDRGRRQERQGTVVSAASDKTIVVRVDTVKVHPMYKKVIRRSTKLHAHDDENQAKPGDIVRIVETRPLSKQKRWRLQEIVEAAK